MKIDAERLRGFLDCMHDEADERDKHSVQIREIVKAAKEAGYDTKAVRKVFARERMDEGERARQDDLLETYEAVLGPKGAALRAIEAGAPVGEAAAANGVHRATLARARSGNSHVAKQPSNATVANEPSIATLHDTDGVITGVGPKPDAETIAWAEKVAAELPREPQSTRPLKDFIAERRAASKITDTSPKAPDASSTETNDGAEHQAEEARGDGDSGDRGDHPAASGIGDADAERSTAAGEDATLPVSEGSAEVGVHAIRLHEGGGLRIETESPPTESLGAVARPSSAERVAPNPNDCDLDIPAFLDRRQRASAPSKEK